MLRIIVLQMFVIPMLAAPIAATEQRISAVPESVERYARNINAAMKELGPVSLETVFEEGIVAADALERGQLERLDEPTYQKVCSMMLGFYITRAEVILAVPNAGFFLKLAREKGTKADQAFFEALKTTYPEGPWPAYVKQQTDYGGCTTFDGTVLSQTYGAWISFQQAYPGRYRGVAQKELAGVQEALRSTCACGGADEVRKGLGIFLSAYPHSSIAAEVASRLQAVNSGTSDIRYNCSPR
jgi:hypothetical protein